MWWRLLRRSETHYGGECRWLSPPVLFEETNEMKKIKALSESDFLKLVFGLFSAAFLVGAFCMPDRASMLTGLWNIVSQPGKISTNYFAVGGYAATFLNMALVGFACLALYAGLKAAATNVSNLACILTLGFCSWGINILNMWFSMLGVVLYCAVKKEKLSANVNAMLFSTGIAPLLTDLMIRYPFAEAVGFRPAGIGLALLVGLFIGFFLPAGLAGSAKAHRGFDLYSAALPVGMTAFLLQAVLYKSAGVALPAAPDAAALQVGSRLVVNLFCGVLFGGFVLLALAMGCRPKDYWQLLTAKDHVANVSGSFSNAVYLMNAGIYGLFILAYYNLIGASFNGVTFGIIFCMLACCDSGSHPGTVWPIMLGYWVASILFGRLSGLVGGSFTGAINAQAIMVGLCYANGLSPISGKYGWQHGFFAAMIHYTLVTTVPQLHGGFCLYNGGFTAALTCIFLIPILERFFKTRPERNA